MDAFQNTRRHEEPEEFAQQMNLEIRIESDHESYESESSLEQEDKMAVETEDDVVAEEEDQVVFEIEEGEMT